MDYFFYIIKNGLILSFYIKELFGYSYVSQSATFCLFCLVSYLLPELVTLCASIISLRMGLLNVWKMSLKCLLPQILYICKLLITHVNVNTLSELFIVCTSALGSIQ